MDSSIITYSKGISVSLTRLCRNSCAYCDFKGDDESLAIPYSTIKNCKKARRSNAREVLLMAGERPDRSNAIRSKLDVWGFESYIQYVYAVCELVFLEGMLPNLNIGYLTESEMKIVRRIAPVFTIMLESGSQEFLESGPHENALYKTLESRLEMIRNAGILKVPVTTGVIVGIGEKEIHLKKAFEKIKEIHAELGHIQNVVIQNFVPKPGTVMAKNNPANKKDMLAAVKLAKSILPEDIIITVPLNLNPDIMPFIKAGVRDLGMVDLDYDLLAPDRAWPDIKKIEKELKKNGWGLQRRLPIFSKFIRDNWYSRKLSQLLDKYRLLIKQAEEKENNAEEVSLKKAAKNIRAKAAQKKK